MPVHHRLRFFTFPMRASRLCSLWPDMRSLRFRRVPFGRDVAFDPGGATASRIAMPPMLPSTVPTVSASATLPTHPIRSLCTLRTRRRPTTAQHSLPGGALPPYRGRSFTGRTSTASPDALGLTVRMRFPQSGESDELARDSVPRRGFRFCSARTGKRGYSRLTLETSS